MTSKFIDMDTKFITDTKGKKLAIILPINEYKEMLEKFEEMEDIKLYDKALENPEENIAAEEAFLLIEKER